MSFKGTIEAQCPGECDSFIADVWSFISGEDAELRDLIIAREINLLMCETCAKPFFPDQPYIYFDRKTEILAFVFPESFQKEEVFWRAKMHEDFIAFKNGLEEKAPIALEPQIYFGSAPLAELLAAEAFKGEEREVMEFIAKDLGLHLYRVSPTYARDNDLPSSLPFAGRQASRDTVIAGLEKLLAANDRLTAFARALKTLKASKTGLLHPAA